MRTITATRIHNGHGWLPEGSSVQIGDDGTIVSVHEHRHDGAVFYEGILAPGLVNAHCHLELSHMKGSVDERTGLIPFLKKIPRYRDHFTEEQKKAARHDAYHELTTNGVVAVGDIANTADTLDLRQLGGLRFHTFVEAIGFNEANAQRSFDFVAAAYSRFAEQPMHHMQAIVPHAPYSVSAGLFRLIGAHGAGVISIHNQESEEENQYYTYKTGAVRELFAALGVDDSGFQATGMSSLPSYVPLLAGRPVMFVHNTYTQREDVQFAHHHLQQAWWCLCPNANLYIENKLPDISLLMSEGANICIGTDSLASNHQLCILSELYTIKERYPEISWETLLTWATRNGAAALQMQDSLGTMEPGKKPGIVQVTGLEGAARPSVKRLV
jgi:aminodeoxyfutalosine deaminase